MKKKNHIGIELNVNKASFDTFILFFSCKRWTSAKSRIWFWLQMLNNEMRWFYFEIRRCEHCFFFLVKNVPLLEKVKLPADHLRNVEVEMHTKRRSHKCGIFHSHNKHSVWRGEVQERQNLFFLLISSGFNSSLAPFQPSLSPWYLHSFA